MKGSYVFFLFHRPEKAFDTVNHRKLYEILLVKGIPRCSVRVLCNMYFSRQHKVCWDNAVLDVFERSNGVR